MKFELPTGRTMLRILTTSVLYASLQSGAALGQNAEINAVAKPLLAELKALAAARRGQWVELPTGGWSTRHYIAELHRSEADNTVLAQRRVDYIAADKEGTTSFVKTTWLHCNAGTVRVVAARGYDAQGRQTFLTEIPDAQAMSIDRLYTGAEQMVCSQMYLLLDVADGYQRLGNLLQMRRTMRSSRVPDRPVPVP